MEEERRLEIKSRTFNKAYVRALADVFTYAAKTAAVPDAHVRLTFQIVSADATSYSSESPDEVFGDSSITELLPVRTVSMSVLIWSPGRHETRRASLSLHHGGVFPSQAVVAGDDPNWVGATFGRIRDVVNSAPSQDHFVVRRSSLLTFLLAFAVATPILWSLRVNEGWVGNIILATLIYLVALMAASTIIYGWLLTAWPSVELDIGPDHFKTEKRRRKRVAAVFAMMVVPVLLRIVYDVGKALMNR